MGKKRLAPLRFGIAIALILSCRMYVTAQQDAPLLKISTEYVLLDILVDDKKTGNSIGALDTRDFVLMEDGVPQNITYFSHDQLPLSVVFLFDLTNTVQSVLKPLAEGARELLSQLKPEDEVSIMVFSSHVELLQDFTTDRDLAAHAIRNASEMNSKDGTFIHEDMYEAVDQAMKSTIPESRRVLVWLTDGTANFENSLTQKTIGRQAPARLHSKQEATAKLLHSGAAVAALIDRSAGTDALAAAADISPLSLLGGVRLGDIDRYAELTGGPVLKSNKREVAIRLADLIEQLRGRYTLGYKPSAPKPQGTYCKLQLKLDSGVYKRHPELLPSGVLLRTRRGYYR
jgi:VWFA-related protein